MMIDQQIACLKREIALRKNVYPKWVSADKMRPAEMEHEIAAMTAALHTLMAVKRLRATMVEHQPRGIGLACSCGWMHDLTKPIDGEPVLKWLDHVFERSKAAAEAEIV